MASSYRAVRSAGVELPFAPRGHRDRLRAAIYCEARMLLRTKLAAAGTMLSVGLGATLWMTVVPGRSGAG